MKRTRTCCSRHCGNGCSLLVAEQADGSVTIAGDPDHPVTKGAICGKTARFMDRLRAPDRIIRPLVREGSGFRETSWGEALDLVASRIQSLRATPERMLHIFYVGSYGLLFRASPYLFGQLGAADMSGDYCLDGGIEATRRDFGQCKGPSLGNLEDSAAIVNWGRNLDAQGMLLGRAVNQARKRGVKVLAVTPGDPGYKAFSDEIITIRPGTDRFLALAAVRVLMERGHDMAQARDRAFNWMEFEAMAGLQSMDFLLGACGCTRTDAERVADLYGRGPTATILGRGLQRYTYGGENVRMIDALAVCAGMLGVPGGGVYFSQGDLGHVVYEWFKRPAPAPRSFPCHRLGKSVMEAEPPVELVFVEGTNVVPQVPDAAACAEALRKPFVVAVEAFMNDTALVADVILPPALMLETEDVVRCSSHGYVHHSAKVFEPPKGCLSGFEISRELAARLDPPVPFPEADEIMEQALAAGNTGADLAELREKTYVPSPDRGVPFEGGVFDHPDGLCRLATVLHAEPEAPEGYPLRLLALVRKKHLLSQIPESEQAGPETVYLDPESAAYQGLDLSRPTYLETELGRLEVRVEGLAGLHPEAAYAGRGGWIKTGRGLNALVGPHVADMAGQCAYHAQWCRVVN